MQKQKSNRLIRESSPYLLQHAHNPVDWHPWGAEAFELARKENKPIFLSVGYSTCYWCHVMERQSFENEQIAAEMNRLFVNIKVDREERPDVDQIYMTAVQVMTHHGGWPMSVWLTTELKPFYAGTYFPPTDAHGRAGFVTICRGIADAWENRRDEVMVAAEELTGVLRQIAKPQAAKREFTIDDAWVERMIQRSTFDYDPENGGFGSAPKFPRETLLRLLLIHQRTFPDAERMKMIRHSLNAMAAGGIRDHLSGGFHRYSTDAHWLVPHFEIMLYDNAMLAWIYAEAFAQTRDDRYAEIARGILDFLLRQMQSPDGAFYTALDAEVDAAEGKSYLWTLDEIRDVLGEDDAEIFSRAYGLNGGPNFADPHGAGGQPDQNVLFRAEGSESIAKSMGVSAAEIDRRLAALREKLYAVRQQRKQPSMDSKILTSWNALAMSAFAHAGLILKDEKYLATALRLATYFISQRHRANKFLDDEAFLADAFLELAEAHGEDADRVHAGDILKEMHNRFADPAGGAYFFTASGADDLIVRQKIGTDSPLPAGAAVAARALLQLGQPALAEHTLRDFAGQLQSQAEGMSAMLELAHLYLRTQSPLKITPEVRPAASTGLAQSSADVVQATAKWRDSTNLIVQIKIHPEFHINPNIAAPGLSATELFIRGAVASRIDYPAPQSLPIGDGILSAYTGTVEIHIHLQKPPSDPASVRLELQYQPCTDTACLSQVRKTIEFAV